MQFSFLAAILTALVIAENCPAEPAMGLSWRLGLTGIVVGAVALLAQGISIAAALQIQRDYGQRDRILADVGRWRSWHTGCWIAAISVIAVLLGWPRIVRFNWGLDQAFLVDELLILLPVLLPLMLSWVAFYRIDQALYSAKVGEGREAVGPAPSLAGYLSVHARHYLGVMLLPILGLLAVQDGVRLWFPGLLDSGWSAVVFAAPIGLLVVFFPVLLRRLWKTRPLEKGGLRERLTASAARAGLPVREILVWETGRMVVNAAVSGWLPGRRYVFLSDGLIARLTSAEIEAVFGHELGHIRHRHLMFRGLAVVTPLCVFFAAELLWPERVAAVKAVLGGLDTVGRLPAALGVFCGLLGYVFFVFGGYCRLMETEADLYGCRVLEAGGMEDPSGVFISGLEKLARECGADREKSTWQHPSIARRTEFLAAASGEPEFAVRFERRVRWMNRLFLVGVLSPVIVAVFC